MAPKYYWSFAKKVAVVTVEKRIIQALLFTDAGIGEVYASRNEKELIA
jgi:hypothetical protein